jgi:hypothetical protein
LRWSFINPQPSKAFPHLLYRNYLKPYRDHLKMFHSSPEKPATVFAKRAIYRFA